MKRILCTVFTIFLLSSFLSSKAQTPTRYLVSFKYKGNSSFSLSNPSSFLSARAIARRSRYSIAFDSTDLPVNPAFLDSLRSIPTVTVLNPSKWLNQVSILISDTSASNRSLVFSKINSFHFVQKSEAIASRNISSNFSLGTNSVTESQADAFAYGGSTNQIKMHNAQFLHNLGLRGEGMVIGMLDAGFKNFLTVKAFDSARARGQILGTWDFVTGNASVNEDDAHGMQCFSVIASNVPNELVGSSPYSSFYLFRSEEVLTEFPIEEHNWVCAAERLDSAGGDVISSSLGYTTFDAPFQASSHTFSQLDGNTTMAARGADLAAKKGVLVVNSAGNEGSKPWGRIATPADGDSVLAVGAVNSMGVPASFTSRGPSADGQVKPDVVSQGVGTAIWNPSNTIGFANGTSFSGPNMAGIATCLWQGFNDLHSYSIIQALRQSSTRSSNPNDTVGYGIPDVRKALVNLLKTVTTFSATMGTCKVTLNIETRNSRIMKYEIQRQVPGQFTYSKIGEFYGTGAVFGQRSISFTDSLTQSPPGSITYRIRLIADTSSTNGYADFLATTTVNLPAACIITSINAPELEAGFNIMPNPVRGDLNYVFPSSIAVKGLTIHINDASGRLVKTATVTEHKGKMILSSLSSGTYFLTVTHEGRTVARKTFMKL